MLFDRLEFVQTYINDLLVLAKGSFEDHLEKLEQVLHCLRRAGLKVNGNKSFLARTELARVSRTLDHSRKDETIAQEGQGHPSN